MYEKQIKILQNQNEKPEENFTVEVWPRVTESDEGNENDFLASSELYRKLSNKEIPEYLYSSHDRKQGMRKTMDKIIEGGKTRQYWSTGKRSTGTKKKIRGIKLPVLSQIRNVNSINSSIILPIIEKYGRDSANCSRITEER